MIKIVNGDLLHATENIIGHQVNCQSKMGSGVALEIRKAYPKAYEKYLEVSDMYIYKPDLLGKTHIVRVDEDKWVANLFGQLNYGYDKKQYTNTAMLYNCLKVLREHAEDKGLSVALPYGIGCYRGGADWKEVEELLLTAFEGYEVTLYKLHKG